MAEANGNNKSELALRQDALALDLILSEKSLELFCDTVGRPCIRLPLSHHRPAEEPWSLRSERVRAWIAEFIWERFHLILLDREIDRVLNVLEGRAWRVQRPDLELCQAIDQDSLLEAILLLMERETLFEGTMTKFQRELFKVGKRAGLDVKAKNWPKGSPQLSKRIRALEHLLAKAKITVDRSRDSYERKIILKRQTPDGPPSSPSLGPSVDKSHHPNSQRRNDATDPEKRAAVLARLRSPLERTDS